MLCFIKSFVLKVISLSFKDPYILYVMWYCNYNQSDIYYIVHINCITISNNYILTHQTEMSLEPVYFQSSS